MKTIPLSRDFVAVVDECHFDAINQFKWSYHDGYAYRMAPNKNGKRVGIMLHRFVMQLSGREPGFRTDHINGIKLDNRASNLRAATASQNAVNSKVRITNKSGFRGVSLHEDGKWVASIKINCRKYHLGLFDCRIQAARAYDAAARAAWPDFAQLNFPETPSYLAA